MIELNKIIDAEPYIIFNNYYMDAISKNQQSIEAMSVSSYNKDLDEVESRFVNLKYINMDEWVFFSNYNSKKAKDFNTHSQVSVLFYWDKINTQIRLKAKIKKTSRKFSNEHFLKRSQEKNALAISSNQSTSIKSYDHILDRYNRTKEKEDLLKRPDYWGGFSFTPYYFEFWEGHNSRINKRNVYERDGNNWNHLILQP
jgi:pyridoxamine-phosphate oxidase